jgi:hypothetical protein
VTGASYLLFYRRREDVPIPQKEAEVNSTMNIEETKLSNFA